MSDATTTTAPAVTAAASATDATSATPWYEGKADPEIIGHWDNKGWKKDDPVSIAIEASKAARELQKHFGVPADQLLKLPKDMTDPAAMREVWQRLGVPGDAKEYDLSGVKFKDGTDLDAAFVDKMRAAMHAAGVPKDKAGTIVKAAIEHDEAIESAAAAERAARLQVDRQALDREWGPNAEFNRLTAAQGARRLGVNETDVQAIEGALGYKRTMEIFHKIGAGTSEDTFTSSGQGGNPTTRNGAAARLAELQSDQAWAGKLLSGDMAARREFDNLMQMIHGVAA